jgi:DNA-directed RNA polymerase specialized sigma24 family protein
MRRTLVDRARRKRNQKRGGGLERRDVEESQLQAPGPSDELQAVDEALGGLAAVDAKAPELVKLRYFVGLSVAEAAQALNISSRPADRLWA